MHFLRGIHFNSAVALIVGFLNGLLNIAGTVAADPSVDLQAIAAQAADEIVNRRIVELASISHKA